MPRDCWPFILGIAVFLPVGFGNWNDTSTGIDLDKLPQFRLTTIRSGGLKEGTRVVFGGITAVATFNEVRLRGRAKSGKPWELHTCLACVNDVWRADLDGNGTQDYIVFGGGPYFNGRMTPLYSLTILLMDAQSLPVPFFTVAYDGANGTAIKRLVDLDHDRRAELLISTYDEAPSDARVGAFCSGHWTTQLYRFKNLGAEEIRGTMGGTTFPFIHEWTYRGTLCAEEEKPVLSIRPPTLYEHGTSPEGEVTTMIRESSGGNGLLAIDPVKGCTTIQPSMIVYESSQIRQIGLTNLMSTYNADLVGAIRRARVPVKLRGVDKWTGNGDCSVNLMWAAK
jgi:hypothetical protein